MFPHYAEPLTLNKEDHPEVGEDPLPRCSKCGRPIDFNIPPQLGNWDYWRGYKDPDKVIVFHVDCQLAADEILY